MSNSQALSCSPLPSTPSSTASPLALPVPAYNATPNVCPKKSHSRKQPPGHIPRPCNAFILFRCDFVRQKKIPPSVEHDHRNISRIAGKVWQEMTHAEKAPWVSMAEKERAKHSQAYPGYRYAPAAQSASHAAKRKKLKDTVKGRNKCEPSAPRRRSSSCPPPGAIPVPPKLDLLPPSIMQIPCTRDDLARRPSQTIMYQVAKEPLSLFAMSDSTFASSQELTYVEDVTFPVQLSKEFTYDYGRIDPPKGMPGWDASPPKPYLWDYAPFQGYPSREPLTNVCQRQNHLRDGPPYPSDWLPPPTSPPTFTDPFSQSRCTIGGSGKRSSNWLDSSVDPKGPLTLQSLPIDTILPEHLQPSFLTSHRLGVPFLNGDYDNLGLLVPRLSITDLPSISNAGLGV